MPDPQTTEPGAPVVENPVMGEDELADERRRGRLAGIATIVSGFLLAIGIIWANSVNSDAPSGKGKSAEYLNWVADHADDRIGAVLFQAVGFLLMVVTTIYLYRAMKARRPSEPRIVLIVGIYGPVAFGVATALAAVALGDLAKDFVAAHPNIASIEGAKAIKALNKSADDAYRVSSYEIPSALGLSGALAVVFWFIKSSYDAMKIGLLPRSLGIVGMILGPAMIFGIGLILVPFWMLAVGFLFLGIFRPKSAPAWDSGKAQPWTGFGGPGAQRRKLQQPPAAPEHEVGGERNGEVEAVGPGVKSGDSDGDGELDADEGNGEVNQPHSSSRKKRKRRN